MLKKHGGTVIDVRKIQYYGTWLKPFSFHGACPKNYGITTVQPKTWKCCETYFYLKWYEIKGFDARRITLCSFSWKEEQIRLHMVSFCLQPRSDVLRVSWYVHHMFAWTHAAPLILPRPRACMCCVSESLERRGSDSSSLQIFQLKGTAHTIFCPIKISSALFIIYIIIYLFVCLTLGIWW